MLELMISGAGFLLGVHLTITLFAACYRIIDLFYCLPDYWLRISARIVLQLTIIVLVYILTGERFSNAFLIGQLFFTFFHIVIYWIGQYVLYRSVRDINH